MPVVPQLAMGVLFVGLYLLELLQGPTIEPLFQLQQQDVYRQITGFLLMVYVLFQWRLAWRRMGRRKIDHKRELNLHMWLGVFTPLVLYVHSSQMGYGYQALFLGVFLTNVLVGLCSPALLKIRHKSYVVYWLVLHSGLAVLVPVLLTYHLYVIYFYD
ncbi:MAG: hypothetical protein AMJ53_02590 [Gammaproteobacteria bacterium SG8_11]|nr:MAG: hypothetical protein AMJ53_02590 [Gammaproteobacteria bacterium SG8_11]